jgi:PAS domain S-box-containing protein
VGGADAPARARIAAMLGTEPAHAFARLVPWDPLGEPALPAIDPPVAVVLVATGAELRAWRDRLAAWGSALAIVAVTPDATAEAGPLPGVDAIVGAGWLSRGSLRQGLAAAFTAATLRRRLAAEQEREAAAADAPDDERLRLAQRAGGVGVFDSDLRTGTLRWTDELRALIGIARDVVPTVAAWNACIHPDDRPAQQRRVAETLAARRPAMQGEYRIVRADGGGERWLQVRAEITYDDDGTPRRMIGTAHDVTDERTTREALRRSEGRLRALFDAAPAGIAEVDPTGRLVYVNRAFCTITGYHPATLLAGLTTVTLTAPEDRERESRLIATAAQASGTYEIEKRYVRPDGSRVWVHVRSSMVRDAAGELTGAIATVHDMTARREAEREASISGERLALALSAMRALTYEQDLATGEARISDEVTAITGHTAAEIAAMPGRWESLLHPDDQPRIRARFDALVASRDDVMANEYRVRHRDGHWVWVWDNLRVVRDAAGSPLRVVGCSVDVSDRKEAERRLEERETTLRAFFEANVLGMVFGDIHGNFYAGNDELLRILGRTHEELLQGRVSWLEMTPPEWLPADDAAIAQARETGACEPYEKEYVRPDGTRVPVLVGYALLGETRERSIAFVLDLTPIKAAEAALRASEAAARASEQRAEVALREAQAANAAKDQFLAVLSHELRTPLAPVLLLASMLLRRTDLPTGVRDQLAMIRRNVDLEVKLIDDLLDLTRIVRGKLELERQPVDLHAQVHEAVRMVEGDAEAQGLALALDLAPVPVRVDADAPRLQQVLWNLVRNAVKFTPRGGTVTVRTRAVEGGVAVDVADTGIGIAAERLPHIFTAFEQGGSEVTRQFGGLGLGLAISKAIVEQHGGTLAAASDGPGTGATFTVTLPVHRGAPLPQFAAPDEVLPAVAPMRVLLVEDHADTGIAVAALLAGAGHAVTTVGSLAAARAALRDGSYDVLVSDLGLPDGSGTGLLATLADDPPPHGIPPAIAMSGFGMEADVARSLAAGFTTHLVKPVTPAALERALALAQPAASTARTS